MEKPPLYIRILTIVWIISSPFAIYRAAVLRDALYGFFSVSTLVCSALMFVGSKKAAKVLIGIWIWASVFPLAWQLDHGFDRGRTQRLLLTAVYISIIAYWLRRSRPESQPPIPSDKLQPTRDSC
jgi:hypothetical protein